ncbi:MAG: segregation/condensation protein A [Rhodocyclales bacterium]|nr:segregation/condensation protein A [Rhodocyclales bacterium]
MSREEILAAGAPIARVYGEPLTDVPEDLFIPPEALRVFLETFEGPLDLLWYLIQKNRLDVRDIPVARLTEQYLAYVEAMRRFDLDLAADYLLMAAMLLEIKSRSLLPRARATLEEGEEGDPRAELMRRLLEYERIKRAARALADQPRAGRDFLWAGPIEWGHTPQRPQPEASLDRLLEAWTDILQRLRLERRHEVAAEAVSVREAMSRVLRRLRHAAGALAFATLLEPGQGRLGVAVTFVALLELCKENALHLEQREPFGTLWVRPAEAAPPTESLATEP